MMDSRSNEPGTFYYNLHQTGFLCLLSFIKTQHASLHHVSYFNLNIKINIKCRLSYILKENTKPKQIDSPYLYLFNSPSLLTVIPPSDSDRRTDKTERTKNQKHRKSHNFKYLSLSLSTIYTKQLARSKLAHPRKPSKTTKKSKNVK